MPRSEAGALVVQLAGRAELGPARPAVAEIARLCGYLPLAIGMLARQLHRHPAWTPADLAADLAATRDRLEPMATEPQTCSPEPVPCWRARYPGRTGAPLQALGPRMLL